MKIQVVYRFNLAFFFCHIMMLCKDGNQIFSFDQSGMSNKCCGNLTETEDQFYDKKVLSDSGTQIFEFYSDRTFTNLLNWWEDYPNHSRRGSRRDRRSLASSHKPSQRTFETFS